MIEKNKKVKSFLSEKSKVSSIRVFANRSLNFGIMLAGIGSLLILVFSYLRDNFTNVQGMFIGLATLCGIFVTPIFAKAWQKGKEIKDNDIPNTQDILEKSKKTFKKESIDDNKNKK